MAKVAPTGRHRHRCRGQHVRPPAGAGNARQARSPSGSGRRLARVPAVVVHHRVQGDVGVADVVTRTAGRSGPWPHLGPKAADQLAVDLRDPPRQSAFCRASSMAAHVLGPTGVCPGRVGAPKAPCPGNGWALDSGPRAPQQVRGRSNARPGSRRSPPTALERLGAAKRRPSVQQLWAWRPRISLGGGPHDGRGARAAGGATGWPLAFAPCRCCSTAGAG